MANLRGRNIRQASVFGLAFKDRMKSVAGAATALAIATSGVVVVNHYNAPAASAADTGTVVAPKVPTADGSNLDNAINADPFDPDSDSGLKLDGWAQIEYPGDTTKGGALVTGYAVIANAGTGTVNGGGNKPVPDGTTVYMQWIDKDGRVSPIYKTKTRNELDANNGAYAFSIPQWTDAQGKVHTFFPGVAYQPQVKVWYEPIEDPETGFKVTQVRNANRNNSFMQYGYGAGSQYLDLKYINNYILFGYEYAPDYFTRPEEEWVNTETREKKQGPGSYSVSGRVWLEGEGSAPGIGPNSGGDAWATGGYKVVLSTLTAEGQQAAQRINGLDQSLRSAEYARVFSEHPEYVKETVVAPIDNEGNYHAQFTEDSWNIDYMYGYVVDPNGVALPAYSSWMAARFVAPNAYPLVAPTTPLVFSRYAENVHFAVVPYHTPNLEITNFNATDKPADRGDTAKIDVTGYLSQGGNTIFWRKNGEAQDEKQCSGITTLAAANECTFTIPEDAEDGDVYTAELWTAGRMIASDSLVVRVDSDGDGISDSEDSDKDNNGTTNDDAQAKERQELTHGLKLIGKGVTKAEAETKAKIVKADGNAQTFDELVVDAEGNTVAAGTEGASDLAGVKVGLKGKILNKDGVPEDITVANGDATSWKGKENFPIVQNFGKYEFGKGTYGVSVSEDLANWAVVKDSQLRQGGTLTVDGKTPNQFVTLGYDTDGDGIADIDEGKDSNTAIYKQDNSVAQGGTGTVPAPTFDNPATADVEQGAVPPGTKFEKADGAPEWATVDPETGAIELKPGTDVTVGDHTVPVKVTYPDGTTETVKVPVKVTEKSTDPAEPKKPSIPDDTKKPEVPGTKDQPIDPVVIPIDNPDDQPVKCVAKGLPAGLNIEYVKGKGCVISGTPTEKTDGPRDITVTIEDPANPGTPIDTIGGTTDIKDSDPSDKPSTADDFTPAYADTLVVPGKPAEVSPTFKDKDGKDVAIPSDAKVTIDPSFKKPKGYTVTIDEKTGKITVTAPEKPNKDTVEEFDVPVIITYGDGTKDEVKAKFKLDTDGDGNPDVTDPDDDGDGVSDKDEIEKGTNPKDSSDKPADWDNTTANPGEKKTIPNKGGAVKEGTTVKVTEGDGTAEIDKDGNLIVTPGANTKPGDKVVVTVTDKDGNVVDTVTVTVTKPATGSLDDVNGSIDKLINDGGSSKGSSDALKKCVEQSTTLSITNPLLWLVPLGLAAFIKIPAPIQAQIDSWGAQFNAGLANEAKKWGIDFNLPHFEIPAALNINTYLSPDQQRTLLGGALILVGLAATSAYVANGCDLGLAGSDKDKLEQGSSVGSFKDKAEQQAKPGQSVASGSSEAVVELSSGKDDKAGSSEADKAGSSEKEQAAGGESGSSEAGSSENKQAGAAEAPAAGE